MYIASMCNLSARICRPPSRAVPGRSVWPVATGSPVAVRRRASAACRGWAHLRAEGNTGGLGAPSLRPWAVGSQGRRKVSQGAMRPGLFSASVVAK